MTIILHNKARCLRCNTVIESTHRHEYVMCRCGAIAVDGGHDYVRRTGNRGDIEDLTEYDMSHAIITVTNVIELSAAVEQFIAAYVQKRGE